LLTVQVLYQLFPRVNASNGRGTSRARIDAIPFRWSQRPVTVRCNNKPQTHVGHRIRGGAYSVER
jgi:hypothetical protein